MATTEATDLEKNPYAYLERDDFTSEKYKIEVRGLPKYYGIGEFKKLLNEKLDLQSCKVKPPKRSSGWLYVSFRNEESRQKAIETLNGILWKNRKLSAQVFPLDIMLFFSPLFVIYLFLCPCCISYRVLNIHTSVSSSFKTGGKAGPRSICKTKAGRRNIEQAFKS